MREPSTPTRVARLSPASPHPMLAGLRGHVVEFTPRRGIVIESRAAVIQGRLGAGYQVVGRLAFWNGRSIPASLHDTILIVPGPLSFSLLRQALDMGVNGIIASSASVRDLEGFLRADIIQLSMHRDIEQAYTHIPPLTLLLTEGPGEFTMPERITNLLRRYEGGFALLDGTTSIPHALVPELTISLPLSESQRADWQPMQPDPTLRLGTHVRVSNGEYTGLVGIIDHFFLYEQIFPSGIRARAARLHLESGSHITTPLTSLEPIG
ncbi:hypothetical protein KSX_17790 [Ktedonospora formicarum]|uniref:Uncharacterized protein n=2 Tax=Ktedonospora formicarum TaxID=2778364 RepID=A0A8J3MRB2_9CHLR|nr:hypothetical protein KSX_17790 [Ktedonospora formicarum]